MAAFTGTSNNDDITGTADADQFDMNQGGDDIVRGLGGDDTFNFGEELTGDDRIIGGNGNDALFLEGDYGFGVVFDSHDFKSIENILLFGDHVFALGFQDSALAAGQTVQIDVAFSVGQLFLFADESNGAFDVFAGDENDTIVTGGGNDTIDGGDGADTIVSGLGNDTINGGNGEDRITFNTGGLTAADRIEGGDTTDQNTVVLDGDYSGGVALLANTFSNIKMLEVIRGNDYAVDLGKTTVTTQFLVDATDLETTDTLDFNGSRVLGGGRLLMVGGAGGDSFTGSAADDSLEGRLGADRLEGGKGGDFYNYNSVADSTGRNYDTVVGFDTGDDLFILSPLIGVAVQAIDAKVTHGKLSTAHFNNLLESAIDDGALGPSHAVVFRPDAGTLAGQTFLIVDGNNVAGYQAGLDLVMRLVDAHQLGALSASDFFTV